MAKVYSFSNQKGGVGKSTTAANLAGAFSEFGKKILLIDLDPQSGLTASLGLEPLELEATIYPVLMDKEYSIDKSILQSSISNADLIPSNLDLAAAEKELIGAIQWDKRLYNVLKQVQDRYDYIFIDCPPSLGLLTVCALVASDAVIVPIQCEVLAMKAIRQLYQVIVEVQEGNPKLEVRFLLTMYDSRTKHSKEVVEEVRKSLKANVFKAVINRTINFADAINEGVPLVLSDPKSKGALAYYNVAKEILNCE